MPTNHELEIIMKLKDEISQKLAGVEGNIRKFANTTKEMGLAMRQAGRQISYIGMAISAVGGLITAPFALALKQASEKSAVVSRSMYELGNTISNLQIKIAEGVLPVVQNLINMFSNLVDRFMALDPAVRDHILQLTLMTGVWLTVGGVLTVIIGKFIAFIGVLEMLASKFIILALANPPLIAILVSIGLIITAMWKWKGVADVVMSTLQGMATLLNTVFSGVLATVEALVGSIAKVFAFLLGILEKAGRLVGSELTNNFKTWREELDKFATNTFSKSIANIDTSVKEFNKTVDIAQGKNTEWADSFNKFKGNIVGLQKTFKDLFGGLSGDKGKSTEPQGFLSGFMLGLEQARQKLLNWAETGKKVATDLTNSMQGTFSNFFNDAFNGQLKKGSDYFAEFGKAILKQFSDVLAQMAVNWLMFGKMFGGSSGGGWGGIVGSLVKAFSGGGTPAVAGIGGYGLDTPAGVTDMGTWSAFHTGGIVRAHGGLAIDEVPIIAQKGERVLSRDQNKAYEKGVGQTISYYIYAVDAKSFVQMLNQNKGSIHAIVASGMKGNNANLRGAMKTYG